MTTPVRLLPVRLLPVRLLPGLGGALAGGALAGGAVAGVVNLALLFGAQAAGVTMTAAFQGPGTPAVALPLPLTFIASVVPAIPAWVVFAARSRVVAAPTKVFIGIAVGFGLFSLVGPLTLEGTDMGTKVVLDAMHVVAGLGISLGLLRAASR